MIYCIPFENYPNEGQFIEQSRYFDQNGFEWNIARVQNGFMVRFFGDLYFKEKYFICELSMGITITVKNTNCIFFKDGSFETFCEVRNILKEGYTDDIWEAFQEFFKERFECCIDILECEIPS